MNREMRRNKLNIKLAIEAIDFTLKKIEETCFQDNESKKIAMEVLKTIRKCMISNSVQEIEKEKYKCTIDIITEMKKKTVLRLEERKKIDRVAEYLKYSIDNDIKPQVVYNNLF